MNNPTRDEQTLDQLEDEIGTLRGEVAELRREASDLIGRARELLDAHTSSGPGTRMNDVAECYLAGTRGRN